jgi:outer membrane protein TolC
LRAEVQVAQARQDLVLSRSNWRTALRRLAAVLNLSPETTIATTTVRIGGFWPLTLEESIVLAFQNRAELEGHLQQREVAETQGQIALSSIRPRLQASGSVNAALALTDIASADIPGFDRNSSAGFGLRLGGSWRVFDGGAAVARATQADRDQDIAESSYAQTRNQIRFEVEESYFNLEANLANIDTARTALEQAREALRLAQRRFDAGVGDQLEVLTAQRELTAAQVNLLEAVLGYNRSLVSLERAVSNLAE